MSYEVPDEYAHTARYLSASIVLLASTLRPSFHLLISHLLVHTSSQQNLPFIQNITKVDPNGAIAHPGKAAICLAEGMGPGLQENVPAGTHVGLQEHYTIFVAGYKTSKRVQEATGFKELTLGTKMHSYV
jgi:hypothetical protein